MQPVNWGILSTSTFATERFLPGLRKSPLVRLAAVGSRDRKRAEDFAETNGIARAYGSYEEVLKDPEVEIVYVPLPNHLHVEWSIKAAKAGKHVLCEKPMGMNAKEVEKLKPLARKVHIAEAFMVRFHPQWIETRERVRRGEIGRVTHIHVAFAYDNQDPKNIRNIASTGGGALYDIGCYAIVAGRWFYEAEPIRAVGLMDKDPKFKTDRVFSALLDFGKGRPLAFTVATQSVVHQRVHIFGTEGRLEITIPFNQPQDDATIYLMHDGSTLDGLDAERFTVPNADQYALQAAFYSKLIRSGEKPSPKRLEDAIRNMRVLDALFKSTKTERFEKIAR
jgi:predicted dehydrogenase